MLSTKLVADTSRWSVAPLPACRCSQVAHAIYYRHCVHPTDPNAPYITQKYTEPIKVTGFPATINSRYSLPACKRQESLAGVVDVATETTTATQYLVGFTFLGFNGKSQSNYTTNVELKFARPAGATSWYWCGDNTIVPDSYRYRSGR